MKSEVYLTGYKRGKSLLGPMHHHLSVQDMKDYLDGYRVGQAEALSRRNKVPFRG